VAAAGETIIVRACKYDGREHRRWSAQLLKREGPLLVLDAYFPEEISHHLLGTIAVGTHSLEYYWLDRWYNVFRFAEPDGQLRNYYCNVNVPPALVGNTLSYIDLDLDILVAPDFSYQILDKDDFETNAALYDYSADVQENASRALDELITMIAQRKFPFSE
jgi:protein associated with RNAse G/E